DGDTYRAVYTVKLARTVTCCTSSRRSHSRDRDAEARPRPDRRPLATREGALRGPLRTEDRLMATRATRSARQKRIDAIPVTRDSGNVFADLGLPSPEERLAKAQLASLINDVIRARGLTQRRAATIMGIDQPKVSHILHGRLAGFSTHRLIDFLTALGRDVEIVVRPAPRSRKRGRLHVAVA
ncbi:MAG: helix-turn-helix domain-containing protein, partial [Gemmatimonadaceae bacterium]